MQIASTPESTLRPSPALRFSILTAFSLVIWFRPLISALALALRDDQYTHILLILPLSVAMIYLDWGSQALSSKSGLRLGTVLLALAAGLAVAGRLLSAPPDQQLALNMLALVTWWIGTFLFCFGTEAFRRALFPLSFLLWMVPLPEFVLESNRQAAAGRFGRIGASPLRSHRCAACA